MKAYLTQRGKRNLFDDPKGAEAQVPDFVAKKLATLTGLVPQATRQT